MLRQILGRGVAVPSHRPWPRVTVDKDDWSLASRELAAGRLDLIGLWGDGMYVHMALREATSGIFGIVTYPAYEKRYPSVAVLHPPALRLERAIGDLWGLDSIGLPDQRAWLDHGRWGVRHPLGEAETIADGPAQYRFLPAEGEGLHQIPVGPVHAGIIEPGHFRFTANGETVVRLEERLGYVHKGTQSLMQGADLAKAVQLAGRVSGDSTVAHALAFSMAVEAAADIAAPPRAAWLRALMAELERLANHFGDFGAICNDASFAILHAHCGILRELVLRTADGCFGHRLMRDQILPGGIVRDLDKEGASLVNALVFEIRQRFPALVELYDNTASLQDRMVKTGIVKTQFAHQFAAGGYIGRSAGRDFDARRDIAYPPYDALRFEVPARSDGDVNARVWLRIREIEQSLGLIDQILQRLPSGPIAAEFPQTSETSEGVALVEGFRGDILAWVRIGGDSRIERCYLRDPSWFQWPLLEAAIEGNIVADFPLCNKSFNCSYSGHDL